MSRALSGSSLPLGWRWVTADAAGVEVFDCPHSTPKLTTHGPFVVRTQDIDSGTFRSENAAHVSHETYRERVARAEPRYGDILYSREGAYYGVAAEVPPNTLVCLGQRMVLVRPSPDVIHHRFLKYWMNSPVGRAFAESHREGSAAPRINLPTIRSFPIPLPPIEEQHAIAATLGVLDDKIESNRRTRCLLRALGRAKLLAAVEEAAVDLQLRDVVSSISRGITPKYADDIDAPLVLNQRCVRDGWATTAAARRTVQMAVAAEKRAAPGDVLVNSTGTGTLGRVGRWHEGEVFVDSHVSVVKPNGLRVGPTVLAYTLFEREHDIEGMATGSTGQTELSPRRLGELPVRLPSPRRMRGIEDTLYSFECENNLLLSQEEHLSSLRDALAPELLSGRIRFPEPTEAIA